MCGSYIECHYLQAVSLPEVTYPLADAIPRRVIDSGQLSSLQLEGIAFAVCICIIKTYIAFNCYNYNNSASCT